MAATHYTIPRGTTDAGRSAVDVLRALAAAWDDFARLRGVMIQRKDGAASGDAVYADFVTAYGYADAATAKASFLEIDSAFGTSDAAVTQMLNRHL